MNEPGGAAIDWGSVFSSAHRRVAIRLAVLAAIGGAGAIFLLGGGVATRAVIQDNGAGPPPPPPKATAPNLTITSIEPGTIQIENAGDADAGPFEVLARIGEEGASVEPPGLEGLAAGESANFQFVCGEGLVTVTAEVRSAEAAEGTEPDDERSEQVSCEGGSNDLPNLTISVEGQTAVITNAGGSPAGEFSITATDAEGAPLSVSPSSVGELAPGNSESVTLECTKGSMVTVTAQPLEGSATQGTGTCGEAPPGPTDGGAVEGPGGSASSSDGAGASGGPEEGPEENSEEGPP